MLKERNELEKNLAAVIQEIKHDKNKINKVKKELIEFEVRPGIVQKFINNPEKELEDIDLRLLCLVTDKVYYATGDNKVKVDDYFTEVEIKSSRQYSGEPEEETIEFPIVLDNVLMIDHENYFTKMDIKFLKKLSQILRYNFETQRDARFIRRQGSIEKVANLNMTSVKQIKEKLLNDKLEVTTITLNALIGTSDEGEELTYNPQKMQLVVHKGTFLDILDGYHRLTGAMNALDEKPNLDFHFQVAIKNFDIRKAQSHIAEINTVNVMSKAHIEKLKEDRYSDIATKKLIERSDLGNNQLNSNYTRVSDTERIRTIAGEIVSYKTLADTIEDQFEMRSKKDAMDVANYLAEFFDYLLGSYPNEFIHNVEQTREVSLISSNVMFAGYIVLARKMKFLGIEIEKLTEIIESIDFSRENPLWKEIGVLEENRISGNAKKKIIEYFSNIPLEEGVAK